MSLTERAIDFIQKGERLIIVTLTISVGGSICAIAERYGAMSFEGAPSWARPVAQLVWILAVVHVVIHGAIGLGRGIRLLAKRASKLPAERRVAAYDAVIIDRLLAIGAVEREILCYALYKRNNHIWTPDDSRPRDWLIKLRVAGLIEISSAQWDTVHYNIHPVAWKYMVRFPTKFINRVLWPSEPWVLSEKMGNKFEDVVANAVGAKKDSPA